MLEGWRRAGARIRTARTRAGHTTIGRFARAAGVAYSTISDLENGRRGNFSHRVLDRVEAELGWAEGSIMRIVEGRREIRQDPDLRRLIDLWPRLSARDRRLILQIAREATRD